MTTTGLVAGIDIDAILGARDRYLAALRSAADTLEPALDGLKPFLESHCLPTVEVDSRSHNTGFSLRGYRPELDRAFWRYLFEQSGLASMMSTKRRKELEDQLWDDRRSGELPPLTRESIAATFGGLQANKEAIFLESVEELYRMISWDHRTNKPNQLGERAVLKNALGWTSSNHNGTFSIPHDCRLRDVERVLCILAGMIPPEGSWGLSHRNDYAYGEWFKGNYSDAAPFEFKGHKNGNVHLRIPSKSIVAQCNRLIAKVYPGAIAGKGK